MRHIHSELISRLQSEEYTPVILIDIDVGSGNFLRFCTWSDVVEYGSDLYHPRGMQPSSVSSGAGTIISGFSLRLDDVDRLVYATIGGRGPTEWPLVMTLVILDTAGKPLYNENAVLFEGWVTEWSYQPGAVALRVSSILKKYTKVTTRLFSASCSVKIFKSSQCGYVGPANVCDRTYEQCENFLNTQNFRGFRHLPEMRDKQLVIRQD